jgi:hypothetical protein
MKWLLMVLFAAFLAAPAYAQIVNLYCSNPNLRHSYFVDVNYSNNTVHYRLDLAGAPAATYPAQITDSQIVWEVPPAYRGDSRVISTLNRITGQLSVCDSAEGCFQRVCKPAQRQF